MEWVEVRGESVAEAEELALDQLGVGRDDAEFEVVQAPENRWLGLKRVEARVRARVRPSAPPPKTDRGRRRKGRGEGDGSSGRSQGSGGGRNQNRGSGGRSDGKGQQQRQRGGQTERTGADDADRSPDPASGRNRGDQKTEQKREKQSGATQRPAKEKSVSDQPREAVSVEEQHDVVKEFLSGVVSGFGLDASVSAITEDDGTIVGVVDGESVGLLVGPRGGTLRALQELARASMQRHAGGRDTSRLMVDVAGYRERRKAALVKFTSEQAKRVLESGEALALEPMGSADRKLVHDAAADIEGIASSSAGEDPRRHVVLSPSD